MREEFEDPSDIEQSDTSAIAEVEQLIDCLINRDRRLQLGPVMTSEIPELRRLLERARKEDLFGLIDVVSYLEGRKHLPVFKLRRVA